MSLQKIKKMSNIDIIINLCKNNNIVIRSDEILNVEMQHIFKLLTTEYVIFLTEKYFSIPNYFLLKYFKRYKIAFYNYDYKKEILRLVDIINKIITKYNCITATFKKSDTVILNKRLKKGTKLLIKLSDEEENNIRTNELIEELMERLSIKKIKLIL